MNMIELTSDNVSEFEDILDPDIAESIGREFFRGIVAKDPGSAPLGALIWEYKNLEEDADTDAEICYIRSENEEAMQELLNQFDRQTSGEEVCLSFFETKELSDGLWQVFSEDGFDVRKGEGRDLVARVSDLRVYAERNRKISVKIKGLKDLQQVRFMQGITNCLFHGKKGLMEDLEYIDKSWFDEEVSCCVITDGMVNGMLLVHRFPSGDLMPVLFTAMGPDANKDLLRMFYFSCQKAVERYPEDTRILVRRHNDSVVTLAKKLFAGRSGEQVVSGERR